MTNTKILDYPELTTHAGGEGIVLADSVSTNKYITIDNLLKSWNVDVDANENNLVNVGLLELHKVNTAVEVKFFADHTTPAQGQLIARMQFLDDNSAGGNQEIYAEISSSIWDPTATSEEGNLILTVMQNGNPDTMIAVNAGGSNQIVFNRDLVINATEKIFLDQAGSGLGVDTYIHEQSADDVEIVVGNEIGHKLEEIGTEVNNVFGALNALATGATNGFIYLPSMAGVPTGNSTDYTGKFPIVWDSTGESLYLNTTGTTWVEIGGGGSDTPWTEKHDFDIYYYDQERISKPSNPATNNARTYVKQIDSDNDGVFTIIKKAGAFTEVQIA